MKIICKKSNLLNGVQIVSKAVSNKTTMPILECILVDATKGIIKLTANDMDLGIETIIEGDIAEGGIIAIEAKLFLEMIRKLPDNDVIIETDDNMNTFISCEKAHFNIVGKSGEDFSYHRISIRNTFLKNAYDYKKVIVPGKTLNEISKILSGDADKDVSIYFTDKHIIFEFDQTIVVSRLIEGEYFKVDQMISSDYETKVKINKKELLNCIDRATLMVKEGDKKPIIIDINDDSMELRINSTIGSMNEKIDIRKEGKDLMIGFNPKFMIDALKVIDDEEIEMFMVNPKAPCFIKDEKDTYLYLILPVNFNVIK